MFLVQAPVDLSAGALVVGGKYVVSGRFQWKNIGVMGRSYLGWFTYPNGRSLLAVQDLEVCPGFVYNPPCNAIKRIDLSEDNAFSNTTEAGITRTRADIVNLWCYEGRSCPGSCCRSTSLRAGMSTAHNNNIEDPTLCVSSNDDDSNMENVKGVARANTPTWGFIYLFPVATDARLRVLGFAIRKAREHCPGRRVS